MFANETNLHTGTNATDKEHISTLSAIKGYGMTNLKGFKREN